jgi:calcineurin-like phosphoesterase family protein
LKTTSERRIGLSDLEQIVNSQDFLRHFVETAWGEANSLEKLITLLMRDGAFTLNQVLEALKHYDIEDRMKVRESLEILELYSLVEHDDEQYRFVLAHFPQFVRAHEDVDALIAALLKEMEV